MVPRAPLVRSVCALAVAALACQLAGCAGSLTSRQPVDPGTRAVRVMSYNIHHGAGTDACETQPAVAGHPVPRDCSLDLPRIAEVIRAEKPDLVGVQEVDRGWSRSAAEDQAARLGALLGMATCHGVNLSHEADAHAAGPHDYGTLILSRYPIRDCHNTALPRTQPANEQRGLLRARIEVGDSTLVFFNTHLHTTEADRRLQIDAVVAALAAVDGPVILTGDLNATPDMPYLAPLFARLVDAWTVGGVGHGLTSPAHPRTLPRARIDYVLASSSWRISEARVVRGALTSRASDHYPVVADLRVP